MPDPRPVGPIRPDASHVTPDGPGDMPAAQVAAAISPGPGGSPGHSPVGGHEGPAAPGTPQVLIAGFGLPGRSISEALDATGVPHVVIEANADVVLRCRKTGRRMVCGDARDPAVLTEAGVASVGLVALMMPVESAVIEAVEVVRRLRPDVRIVARVTFTSTGLEATRRGADAVVVAEQVVALDAARTVAGLLPTSTVG